MLKYDTHCFFFVFFFQVYPSLESDEEDLANKVKMKRKKNWEDTPWSPKGNHSDQQDRLILAFYLAF